MKTSMRRALTAAMAAMAFGAAPALAQSAMGAPTPGIAATSPLGMAGDSPVPPTGIPLGATELASPGISPEAGAAMGMPVNAAPCAADAAQTSGLSGAGATYDGGGVGMGVAMGAGMGSSLPTTSPTVACGAAVAGSPSPSSAAVSVLQGGMRTGIPLGSLEIDSGGVSPLLAVPVPPRLHRRWAASRRRWQPARRVRRRDRQCLRLAAEQTRRKPMRRELVISAVLLTIVLAAGGAFAFQRRPTKAAAAAAPAPVTVVAGAVAERDLPIYLTGVGTVIAYNTVVVRSQIQGQIVSINFAEGQAVRKGDLLAQIDPRPYQAQVNQYTATRDRDQAQLTNALTNLNRYTPLATRGFATQQLLDTQKAQVSQLQNAVKSDEALIDAANVQLSYARLTSPIDGVTGIRQVDIGNIIHPTDPNGLVVVTQIEPISLIFTLPETELPKIQQQQEKANGPLTVLAYSQDDKFKLDVGKLTLVDNEILQTTGSIRLKAEFPNKSLRLWPGELVNARLLLETRHDGLTVPASVVQQGPQGAYAYVIAPDGAVAIQPISVAQISEGQALIDSGLKANQPVVVDGQYKLSPGSRVTVLHGRAAEEAAAQTAQQDPIP
jgi:multidrug efflux system membrane fusion protein